MSTVKAQLFLHELNAEYQATRTCLERISETTFEFKPHPKSMNMGYLAMLVAEIPLWIKHMVTDGEIDFVTYKHFIAKTNTELVAHFEENMEVAREALQNVTDEALEALFTLKANGQVLYTSPKVKDIAVTLNHWVHHRGQLTVYMRLNDIAVPSIYGPSADDKNFAPPK
ncbi:MAG: DinB family protein [Bacteroidota bacterium]